MLISHVLSDRTAFEEPLMDVALTVIVDERGQLIKGMTLDSGPMIMRYSATRLAEFSTKG
ncbi:hypothetical protein AZE42_06021 [Rhizopogon vesiculosus]|uniref:Uncharacterized protein n=1 Tax=Rhizopogon vesiculosus TaxID=180088 RepID=A0A1J8Q7L1_9AGAM|nr:hypothetical protein AZE42_06021 [Rhizopogon vesiculosus]